MRVVFFVEGATDPIDGFEARGVRFVPIAAGPGEFDTTISCFHLAPGSHLSQIPFLQDTMLLVLHGELTLRGHENWPFDLLAGMGVELGPDEIRGFESAKGAIVLAVESPGLIATKQAISTPDRIAHQSWPTDPPRRRTLGSVIESIYLKFKYWRLHWVRFRTFLARSCRTQKDTGSSGTSAIAKQTRDDCAREADVPRAE